MYNRWNSMVLSAGSAREKDALQVLFGFNVLLYMLVPVE
jgi:hypothetical protein